MKEHELLLLFDFIYRTIYSVCKNDMTMIETKVINPFFAKYRSVITSKSHKVEGELPLAINHYRYIYNVVSKLMAYSIDNKSFYRNIKNLYLAKDKGDKIKVASYLALWLLSKIKNTAHDTYVPDTEAIDMDAIYSKYKFSDVFTKLSVNKQKCKIYDYTGRVIPIHSNDLYAIYTFVPNKSYDKYNVGLKDIVRLIINPVDFLCYWFKEHTDTFIQNVYDEIKYTERKLGQDQKSDINLYISKIVIYEKLEFSEIKIEYTTDKEVAKSITSPLIIECNKYIAMRKQMSAAINQYSKEIIDKYREYLTFTSSDYIHLHSKGFDAIFRTKSEYFNGNNNDIVFRKMCKNSPNEMHELTKYLLSSQKYEDKPIREININFFELKNVYFSKINKELTLVYHINPEYIKQILEEEAFSNICLIIPGTEDSD